MVVPHSSGVLTNAPASSATNASICPRLSRFLLPLLPAHHLHVYSSAEKSFTILSVPDGAVGKEHECPP
jgi:hypothetical protein